MRHLIWAVLLLFNIVLQTTVMPHVEIYGTHPNLILMQVILTTLLVGGQRGLLYGAGAGLFLDLLSARYIGFHSLSFAGTSWLIGLLASRLYKENLFVPLISIATGTVIHSLLAFALGRYAGIEIPLTTLLLTMIAETIYNTVLMPLLYKPIYRAANRWWIRKEELGA
ncbi:rod shape-determining protein MreD [Heliophilum fasciatum]|uniref:Rod shape-determining protein MreD n=1 Tax=Heliophilum fasciatum TaxID=35700 RepID=A0A4R2SAI0_9FIRM|nr:rod shape-determining protein MreD [Heliophilum fasciatum]MCW2277138.1 rod shape-determining protein MreD [Heliophilum fasciatum]TCP68225.1 rod shape-determining protein MreD [Heliophilum fasciatum]